MWDGIDRDSAEAKDLSWLVTAMKNNRAIWVTDGSHDRKRAPTLSSAGWLVFCPETKKFLTGNFVEVSKDANSYRGELLGLCAVQLFILAMQQFFDLPDCTNRIICDCEGAIKQASWKGKKV